MSNEKKQEGTPVYLLPQHDFFNQAHTDEINIVDIWRTLVKRKKTIFTVFAAFVVVGVLYSLIKPEKFMYSTVILIGMQAIEKDGEVVSRMPIESIDDALNKLKSAYVPLILSQEREKNAEDYLKREINVNTPKGSNVIVLDMVCKPKHEQKCKSLLEGAAKKLIDDDSIIAEMARKSLNVKIISAENGLKRSKDEAFFLEAKKARLLQTEKLLGDQIKEKKALLERSLNNRGSVKSNNAANAMSVLLIDNEIQRNQTLLDDLEKRLLIDLNQERDDLEKAQKENIRQQSVQENAIVQLKNLLLGVSNTKAVVPVLRSDEPVGITLQLIMVFTVLLGLMAGLMTALALEAIEKAKAQSNGVVNLPER